MSLNHNKKMNKKTIVIDIVSDTICPWCWVGKRQLEKAILQTRDLYDFKINWHPFLLNEKMKREGEDKDSYYLKKFGKLPKDMGPQRKYMTEVAQSLGINFNFDGKIVPTTIPSHNLVSIAKIQDKEDEMVEALFESFFSKAENIGDPKILKQIANNVGIKDLDLNELEKEDEVQKEQKLWKNKYDISGVPYFIFNGQFGESGAQPAENFLKFFKDC